MGLGPVVPDHLPDLQPLLEGCRLSVAPLCFGAGLKGKINQSMAHGLPVVATTCAAEGKTRSCEIWTRVMGYYRPKSAFNIGKQGEYDERTCFCEPK